MTRCTHTNTHTHTRFNGRSRGDVIAEKYCGLNLLHVLPLLECGWVVAVNFTTHENIATQWISRHCRSPPPNVRSGSTNDVRSGRVSCFGHHRFYDDDGSITYRANIVPASIVSNRFLCLSRQLNCTCVAFD